MSLLKRFWFIAVVISALCCPSITLADDLFSPLEKFRGEKDRVEQERLLYEILKYPDAGAQLLLVARSKSDPNTKWMAIRGTGFAKYQPATPFLIEWLSHHHYGVRANAARALGEIRAKLAIPALVRLLRREKNGGVIEQTSLALQWLEAREAVPTLKRAASHPSTQTRCWVLQAVGKLGSRSDLPFLAKYLYDPSIGVCMCAAQAIEVITGEDFGFPKREGPMNPYPPVETARRWWEKNKARLR
jgi:HEAT repeats